MAGLFVLNVCVTLAIGAMRPMASAYAPRESHAVDMTPWSFAKPMGAVIVAIVVSTYFIFT